MPWFGVISIQGQSGAGVGGLGHLGGEFWGASVPWFGVIALHGQFGGAGAPGSWLLGVPEPLGLG